MLSGTSYAINNLNLGQDYYFTVDAFNDSGLTRGTNLTSALAILDLTKYECEKGILSNGATATSSSGASGGAYVGNMHLANASCLITNVDGGSGGGRTLDIIYALNQSSTLSTYVNGALVLTSNYPPTGGWSTFTGDVRLPITLNPGTNNGIALVGGQGGVNLDYIAVTGGTGSTAKHIQAASYNSSTNVQTENCSEGGLDVGYIFNGSWIEFDQINLTGQSGFQARVASAESGGDIQIRLDSPTGTLVGTCAVPITSGWQTWTTVNCPLNVATGYHKVYLVFVGGSGNLFNIEWFAFEPEEVLTRTGWIVSASSSDGNSQPLGAIDGDTSTRWSTGALQVPDQWFQVDLGSAQTFNQVVLDCGASSADFPRSYQVNVSNDGSNWGSVIATGTGSAITTITFAAQTARYIRVTQTGTAPNNWWSIAEFNLYAAAATFAAAPNGLAAVSGDGFVNLQWNSSAGASNYNIQQATVSGGPYVAVATNILSLSFTNANLVNGTLYYYLVVPVGSSGPGSPSAEIAARPFSTVLSAISSAGQNLTLIWATNLPLNLYYTTNLIASNSWSLVTNVLAISNGQWFLTLPASAGTEGYFRLH